MSLNNNLYQDNGLFKPKHCNHINIQEAEVYYGILETQYYNYYFCEDCGDEIENEPNEDCYKERER